MPRILLSLLLLLCFAAPTASASTTNRDVSLSGGGTARLAPMSEGKNWVRRIAYQTVARDRNPDPLAAQLCPSGRVVISIRSPRTIEALYRAKGGTDPDTSPTAALFIPGATTCRILLNSVELDDFSYAEVCNTLEHELGHARGYSHTEEGLMAAFLPATPVDVCTWTQNL